MADEEQPVSIGIGGNVGAGTAVGSGASVYVENIAGGDLHVQNILQIMGDLHIQGLQKLPMDYGSPIRGFLREYTGIGAERIPFGGRDAELAQLDAWWQNEQSPAYALLVAEAGRGKSALLVQWAAQMTARNWAEVIFIPISIRFQTNSQTAVFATLAARLSELHGESWSDKPIQMSVEEYRPLSRELLEKPLPEGKRLLVVLDGLDEASGWRPGPHLFPPQLPPGTKLIASTRIHGRTDKNGWLDQLHWHKGRAVDFTLPILTRQGVADVLVKMGNPLDVLASEMDVVSTLHHLSEGDPLLVRLYVEQLLVQMSRFPGIEETVAWLEKAEPGLAGYFGGWWRDQRQWWGSQSPLREQAAQDFFNLLAVALGPLSQADVQALQPSLGTWLLEEIVESLGRLVIGDGREQSYAFSHPRLGYYFYEQLGAMEKRDWEQRFVRQGEETLRNLRTKPKVGYVPSAYVIRHYTAHLDRAQAGDSAFDALVCQEWAEAWNALEGTYAGFLSDIGYVRERAVARHDLGMAIWCDLCRSSITTLSNNIPPDMLAQTVPHNLFTPRQALIIARQMTPPERQSNALAALLPQLPADMFPEALTAARSIEDEKSRAQALGTLAPHLPTEQQATVWAEALAAARSIADEWSRAQALEALAPHLPTDLLAEALTAARSIAREKLRAQALEALAPHLPTDLLAQALAAARSIAREKLRAQALEALAPHLPTDLLAEALAAARSIAREWSRAQALGTLAPHLPTEQQAAVWAEALAAARSIADEWSRAQALGTLAPHLPTEQQATVWAEALAAARSIEDEWFRAQALGTLAPHLPTEQQATVWAEALAAARSIEDEWSRAQALGTLAPHLPTDLLAQALAAARSIAHEWSRAQALGTLAPHLPTDLLAEALAAARSIAHEWSRAQALEVLVPQLVLWAPKEPAPTYVIWIQTLSDLAKSSRPTFLRELAVLMPFTLSLVKEEEKPALAQKIAAAILAVAQWWP